MERNVCNKSPAIKVGAGGKELALGYLGIYVIKIDTYRSPPRLAVRVSGGRITLHNAALHIGIAVQVVLFHTHWSHLVCLIAGPRRAN